MKPEAQRIAIAEACGWKLVVIPESEREIGIYVDQYWTNPSGESEELPDYLNDLNAMHEAEKVLKQNQFHGVNYPHSLFKVVTGLEWKGDMGYFFPMVIRAPAAQRAEAFLRTIGKWIEE